MIHGVDVSNWQRDIDWPAVARSGVQFALLKASEDPNFFDGTLAPHWEGARSVGLVRGAYHFARPSETSPADSVAHFERALRHLGQLDAGDLIALDIEDDRFEGSLHVWVAEWLDLAERVFGFPPIKYSGKWYTATRDLEHSDLARWPTWWAEYETERPVPRPGWSPIDLWQYTAHAAVPGVQGDCDANFFFGSLDDLKALGSPLGWVPKLEWTQAPAEPPPPPEPPAEPPPAGPDPAVIAALDALWTAAGPDVEKQRAIVAVKVAFGIQEAA